MISTLLRQASENAWLRDRVPRYSFVRRAVRRFVPGEDLECALTAAGGLGARGIRAILTQLGESVTQPAQAEQVARHYSLVLDRVRAVGIDAQPSVKPTQLGFDLENGHARCRAALDTLLTEAARAGNYIWIDMEASRYVDATLEMVHDLRRTHDNVGICVQTYLYRTAEDVARLIPLGIGVRLVKGAYKEPASVAYPRKADVDRNFVALAAQLWGPDAREAGTWAAFGTHDRALIAELNALAASNGVARDQYEYQMLFGIQREAQERLAREGYRVRVMINYGTAWFAWYMRRLAERPANLLFVVRSMFAR